ncbi:MAG: hypothetical protein ACI884_002527, partial [Ulvibacter sp.]
MVKANILKLCTSAQLSDSALKFWMLKKTSM